MRHNRIFLWAFILVMIGFTSLSNEAFAQFTEESATYGVNLTHDGATAFPTDMGMGTGAAWLDFDNDGDLDLYMTMRGGANKLWRNDGGSFVDVAVSAGAGDASHDGSGVAVADYNNDGCVDIYLANGDEDVLLENDCDGTFTDITAGSGLDASEERRGTSASWGDYDDDGFVDLYVANHMPIDGAVNTGDTEQDYVFHNNGDGTFTDVSDMLLGVDRQGRSFIAGWSDYDRDGDLDIYTIRDCPFGQNSGPMRLYRNDGGTDGLSDWSFTERAADAGADYCQNGMGLATGDYDNNGYMDFFYTDNGNGTDSYPGSPNRNGTVLLANNGDGSFTDATDAANVDNNDFSWGATFLDYDLDGYLDLYMAAGALNDPNVFIATTLWRNDGDGTFTDATPGSGTADQLRSRSVIRGDFNGDGAPDMFLVNYGATTRLFENKNESGNNFLILDLNGSDSNKMGIGAWIKVTLPNGMILHEEVRSGSSLGGGDDVAAYFGLGDQSEATEVEITWPSGNVQTLDNVAANQRMTVNEDGSGGGGGPGPGDDLFTDVTSSAGLSLLHDGGDVTDMGMGTGAAWLDYDNDGDQDVYVTLRTKANKLYRNNGDGTFTDVAASAGVTDASGDGSGVVAADYNNDGCIDLYLANGDADVLFENDCDGTFTNVTAGSGLESSEERRGTTASFGDYDNDGFLDLYVANHMNIAGNTATGATEQIKAQDYIYHNNGDGTFTDVSDMLMGTDRQGMSFIGGWTDYDEDGDLDVYKVNDCPFDGTAATQMFRNDGGTDGASNWTFTEVSASIGVNYCQNAMGLAVGDYNRDGDLDMYISDNGNPASTGDPMIQGTAMFRNDGGTFTETSVSIGVNVNNWSWGTNFFDYDLDGWQDLYLAAGNMNQPTPPTYGVLWHNDGGTFTDVSNDSGGLNDDGMTRTSVYADYDNDGDADMLLVNYNGDLKLYRNDNDNSNNYLIVDLIGVTSNRNGVGARIEVSTPDGVTQHFETRAGSSLGGGDDLGAYFGLGSNASINSVTVNWPSGNQQVISGPAVNQRMTITEEGGTCPAPSASFTSAAGAADFEIDFDGSASTVCATRTISSYAWSFGDGNIGSGAMPSHTYAAAGTYAVALTVTDSEGDFDTVIQNVTVDDPGNGGGGGTGAFIEADGMIVIEAENFHDNIDYGGDSWTENTTEDAEASGGASMESGPDDGSVFKNNPEGTSPELVYEVNFSSTGDYHVWARIFSPDSKAKSVHFGLNGAVAPNGAKSIQVTQFGVWEWAYLQKPGSAVPLTVASAGYQTLHIWEREDGAIVDKIVLTLDSEYVPTGEGPEESEQETGENLLPVASFTFEDGTGDLEMDFDGSGSSDPDGTIVSWDWDFGDGNTGSGETTSHTYAAAGTYSVELTVTDDGGATSSTSQDVTVTEAPSVYVEEGGFVAFEGEGFHGSVARGGQEWTLTTDIVGYCEDGAMITPDDGIKYKNNPQTQSPELSYDISFTTTGDYYVWIRVYAEDSKDKSIFVGLDGGSTSTASTAMFGQWDWIQPLKQGLPQTVSVDAAGVETLMIWMREDGMAVDKIVLTDDPNYVPDGEGPEASLLSRDYDVAQAGDAVALQEEEGIGIETIDLPTEFALEGNYPNPFNPTTTIQFALPEASQVYLEVFDAMGRRVATLIQGELAAGRYEQVWNGRTDAGNMVASGMYLYRLTAGNFSQTKTMLLMK